MHTLIYQKLLNTHTEEWCSGIRPKLLRSPKFSKNTLLRPFSPTTPFFVFVVCFDCLFGISIFPVNSFSSYFPTRFVVFERRDEHEQAFTAFHFIDVDGRK